MMVVYLAQYRGIGPLSRGIRIFTRSQWSHSAIVVGEKENQFTLYEAWGTQGVTRIEGETLVEVLSKNHHPGTRVDLYGCFLNEYNIHKGIEFIEGQVGSKYDWALITKFVTRGKSKKNDKWICSELAGQFYKVCGRPLQRMPTWKMAPEHCGISTVVIPRMSVRTIRNAVVS